MDKELGQLDETTKKNIEAIKQWKCTPELFEELKDIATQYIYMESVWQQQYFTLTERYNRLLASYESNLQSNEEFLDNIGELLEINVDDNIDDYAEEDDQ